MSDMEQSPSCGERGGSNSCVRAFWRSGGAVQVQLESCEVYLEHRGLVRAGARHLEHSPVGLRSSAGGLAGPVDYRSNSRPRPASRAAARTSAAAAASWTAT